MALFKALRRNGAGYAQIGAGDRLFGYDLNVVRANLATTPILTDSFVTTGETVAGDLGAGALYVLGTSGGLRAVQDLLGRWFNLCLSTPFLHVGHFGAKGDWTGTAGNGTNDQAAFQSMLDATLGRIVAPKGRFRLTAGVACTAHQQIDITGAGLTQTEICFDGAVAIGFNLDQSATVSAATGLSMSGLRITTTQVAMTAANRATPNIAVKHLQKQDINVARFHLRNMIREVQFIGNVQTTTGWDVAWYCNETLNVVFMGCGFMGMGGDYYPNDNETNNTVSRYAVQVEGSSTPSPYTFQGCAFSSWLAPIRVNIAAEGIHVTGCQFVLVGQGILWTSESSGHPLLAVADSHINAFTSCFTLTSVIDISIHDNDLYPNQKGNSAGRHFDLTAVKWGHIHDNKMWFFNYNYPGAGIVLQNNCENLSIHDNLFNAPLGGTNGTQKPADIGIWVRDGTNRTNFSNDIKSNKFPLSNFITADIRDEAGAALSRNRYGRASANIARTSTQSFSTNSGALVVFDTTQIDMDGALTSNTTVTVPAGRGIRMVKVSAGADFAANATGLRSLAVLKNGAASYAGAPKDSKIAISGSDPTSLCCSGEIPVVGGDTLQMAAQQNSGAALNLASAFLNVEFVL